MTTTFPVSTINRLRSKAARATATVADGPDGWSKSQADLMAVLAAFKPLRIENGYELRAYQFTSGGNGNAVVWAMPSNAPFPEPAECQQLEDGFLRPPKPPGAVDDLMTVIRGDGTPLAYLCASIFSREILEFGARWHGCDWSTHEILGSHPSTRRRSSSVGADWNWQKPVPKVWLPSVVETKMTITVTFFTFSGLGQEAIYRHRDKFRRGSYDRKTDSIAIALGAVGYTF
jgi:hypothetical protein